TVLFGGSIVAASLGGFYWNLHRIQRKKAARGDLPYCTFHKVVSVELFYNLWQLDEYLLAHVASRGPSYPVSGAAELPLSRYQLRGSAVPPPIRDHNSGHSTIANYLPSAKSDEIRGRLEQPTPQRAKETGSSLVYTKSPDYANSYEKTAAQKLKNVLPTVEKTDVQEMLGASP
ncbi:hypothetical protein C0992_005334, partial [Termitomyces sp. T32_za158]